MLIRLHQIDPVGGAREGRRLVSKGAPIPAPTRGRARLRAGVGSRRVGLQGLLLAAHVPVTPLGFA